MKTLRFVFLLLAWATIAGCSQSQSGDRIVEQEGGGAASLQASAAPAGEEPAPAAVEEGSTPGRDDCSVDEDCVLMLCSGCVNRVWIRSMPPEPPCARFAGYQGCRCVGGACEEIGPP